MLVAKRCEATDSAGTTDGANGAGKESCARRDVCVLSVLTGSVLATSQDTLEKGMGECVCVFATSETQLPGGLLRLNSLAKPLTAKDSWTLRLIFPTPATLTAPIALSKKETVNENSTLPTK